MRDARRTWIGCAILESIEHSARLLDGADPKAWLTERDAARSWVFDMAPVRVAPTKNVVAQVQIYAPSTRQVEHLQPTAGDPLVIGKLFVTPDTFEYGIERHLLKESVRYVRGQGRVPVLDLTAGSFLQRRLYEKLGFEAMTSRDPDVALMVHTKVSRTVSR